MDFKVIGLWLARKALYTVAGAVLAVVVAYLIGHPNFEGATLTGLTAGLGSAIFGDLRRKLFPDFLQIVAGEDPRVDG